MDLTQSELARLVGYDAQQVARWEKGENRISGPADRLLRMLIREHLKDDIKVRDILQILDDMDARLADKTIFEVTAEGWRYAV